MDQGDIHMHVGSVDKNEDGGCMWQMGKECSHWERNVDFGQ